MTTQQSGNWPNDGYAPNGFRYVTPTAAERAADRTDEAEERSGE